MKNVIDKIKQFHRDFDFNVRTTPQIPTDDVVELRNRLILEEVEELRSASESRDIVECADALGDILYILLGTACEYGLIDKLEAVFDAIHENNMRKKHSDGKVHKRADGKVIKPEGFEKVSLEPIIFDSPTVKGGLSN